MPNPTPIHHALWAYLHDEHGLTLLESELDEVVRLANTEEMDRLRTALTTIRDNAGGMTSRFHYDTDTLADIAREALKPSAQSLSSQPSTLNQE